MCIMCVNPIHEEMMTYQTSQTKVYGASLFFPQVRGNAGPKYDLHHLFDTFVEYDFFYNFT